MVHDGLGFRAVSLFRRLAKVGSCIFICLLIGASVSSVFYVFRRKSYADTCRTDALKPTSMCVALVMGPELSRITSASISLLLTSTSSPGLYSSVWVPKDSASRLLEWTTSGVDSTGFRWPDQGLVSLASPVTRSESPSGQSRVQDCSPVETSDDLCLFVADPGIITILRSTET